MYAQQRYQEEKIFFSNDNYITNNKSLLLHRENYSWSTYDSELLENHHGILRNIQQDFATFFKKQFMSIRHWVVEK